MSRFNVMPRTYRARAWICDHIAPPDYKRQLELGRSEEASIAEIRSLFNDHDCATEGCDELRRIEVKP